MIKLNKTEQKALVKYFLLCKDFDIKIDNEKKEIFLQEKDYKTLKAIINISKGY